MTAVEPRPGPTAWPVARPLAGPTPPIERIDVVVPAHDEEATIGRCLAALDRAATHPELAGVTVAITVVLDSCGDGTASVVARWVGAVVVTVVAVTHRSVGAARASGLDHVLRVGPPVAPDRHWLACTDADSTVPRDWLARQVAWRRRGADAIAGTVTVEDWGEHGDGVRRSFEAHQARLGLHDGHGHVHGANLGFTAAAYRAAGTMPALASSEDHALWSALRASGHLVVAAGDLAVVTSARRAGRAPDGFSQFLRALPPAP